MHTSRNTEQNSESERKMNRNRNGIEIPVDPVYNRSLLRENTVPQKELTRFLRI